MISRSSSTSREYIRVENEGSTVLFRSIAVYLREPDGAWNQMHLEISQSARVNRAYRRVRCVFAKRQPSKRGPPAPETIGDQFSVDAD